MWPFLRGYLRLGGGRDCLYNIYDLVIARPDGFRNSLNPKFRAIVSNQLSQFRQYRLIHDMTLVFDIGYLRSVGRKKLRF